MRVLVVEDERSLADTLVQILKKNHHSAECVYDGNDGLDYALAGSYDIVILDVMMPGRNGFEVAKEIRKTGSNVAILMLTARGEVEDRVRGLDSGADDYLPKPFATEELLARVRALSRRKGEIVERGGVMTFGDIELNVDSMVLSCRDKEMRLTNREEQLLEFLIRNRGIVCSKETIIERVWGPDSEAEHNHVEVYVSFLRKKFARLGSGVEINAVRGVGYLLAEGACA